MKNYLCAKCGTAIQSEKTPSAFNCLKGGHHQWTDLGEVGNDNYQCKKCGLLLKSKKTPAAFSCAIGGHHQWTKL